MDAEAMMSKFVSWCFNSTLSVAVVYLISLYLGFGPMAGYANSVFTLLLAMAYVMTNRSVSSQWAQVRIASLFAMSSSIMFLTLVSALARPEETASSGWLLVGHLVASVGMLVALICTGFFAFVASRELKLKYSHVILGFFAQGVAFCLIFAYVPRFIQKLMGS